MTYENSLTSIDHNGRRVLLVSYHFPPVGGAGVQRPVKFAKYLPDFGWEASALVAENPSVPVFDHSLCADLPDDLVIERARTWEPGYALKRQVAASAGGRRSPLGWLKRQLRGAARRAAGLALQPDAQILWVPNALRAAARLLRKTPHDAILATAPPYSNLLLGCLLKRRFGLPLIVDYRDEWDLSSRYLENSQRDWFSQFVQGRMQRWVLQQADVIVATTRNSARRLEDRARQAGGRARAHCIYNGYDPADFAGAADFAEPAHEPAIESSRSGRFRLVYTGTLWNLTSVEPLVQAVELLERHDPQMLDRLELVFVGRKTPEQQVLLDRLRATRASIVCEDYCDHSRALTLMCEADALLVLLSAVEGAERVVTAKLFEYLAARKPLLAVVPQGETAEIVNRFLARGHYLPADVRGIANWLVAAASNLPGSSDPPYRREAPDVSTFSRPSQAGELAELLNSVCRRRPVPALVPVA